MINQDEIRTRIRKRLKDLDLPMTGLWLKENGIGQTTIRNFLDRTNNSLTVETVAKLAEPLKTTERWLLLGEGEDANVAKLPPPLPNEEAIAVVIEEILRRFAGIELPSVARRPAASHLRHMLGLLQENPARQGNLDGIRMVVQSLAKRPPAPMPPLNDK